MKKLMMIAAMLALVAALAVPAIAQSSGNGNGGIQQVPIETFVSGTNTNTGGAVNSSGSNSNTCAAQQVFNNSGGLLTQQSQQQYASNSGGLLFLGSTFNNTPEQTVPCTQAVQQAASASSGS